MNDFAIWLVGYAAVCLVAFGAYICLCQGKPSRCRSWTGVQL